MTEGRLRGLVTLPAGDFAVTAEAVLYRAAGACWGSAMSISFVVNAASVLAGFALQSLGWI
jgi:hypothetical protein